MAGSLLPDTHRFEGKVIREYPYPIFAPNRPQDLDIDWNIVSHPYKFVVRAMLDTFHANRITNVDREKIEKIIPAEERVDFYFDNHSSQRAIQEGWEA